MSVTAEEYRRLAQHCRERAAARKTDAERKTLLGAAAEFDANADEIEKRAKKTDDESSPPGLGPLY